MAESQNDKRERLRKERTELRQHAYGHYPKIGKAAGVNIRIVYRWLNGDIEHSKVEPYIREFVKRQKQKTTEDIASYYD